MIELIQKRIHMTRRSASAAPQVTLDDDFNVPDTMEDVEQLILESGEIRIESAKTQNERAVLKGQLNFRILYRTPGGQVTTLGGSMPFEEIIQMPGLSEKDDLQTGWELDDLNVGLINSRKLSVKALVTLKAQAEAIGDSEAAADARFDGTVEMRKRTVQAAALAVRRKDTFRVKEVFSLSANKPDIDSLLWKELRLRGVNTKPLDGKIHIDGELMAFAIYSGEDGQMPVQCMEEVIPFSGEVELSEAVEGMIPFITVRLVHKDMEAGPDSDGEMREITVDAVMELDIRLYEEREEELLCDLYALDREVLPDMSTLCFEQIAARNMLKHRIQEKVSLPSGKRILQICHSDGDVKLDEVRVTEEGLSIDGVLEAKLLYLTADDQAPVGAEVKLLPFHLTAEIPGLSEDCTYRMESGIEQLSAVMLGGEAVEIKASVTLDILVMRQVCEQVICGVREEPLDVEKLKQMPGIVGYRVQPGDTLWKLARTFHTSVDAIMETNQLTDSEIHPGDKLLLVKAVREKAIF